MAADAPTTATRPPDPPPPPPPPPDESRNQDRADRDSLRPAPESRKGLDDVASRKEAGQASGELANPGGRPTDKGLEPTRDFQQELDDFRASKQAGQESGRLVDFSTPQQPDQHTDRAAADTSRDVDANASDAPKSADTPDGPGTPDGVERREMRDGADSPVRSDGVDRPGMPEGVHRSGMPDGPDQLKGEDLLGRGRPDPIGNHDSPPDGAATDLTAVKEEPDLPDEPDLSDEPEIRDEPDLPEQKDHPDVLAAPDGVEHLPIRDDVDRTGDEPLTLDVDVPKPADAPDTPDENGVAGVADDHAVPEAGDDHSVLDNADTAVSTDAAPGVDPSGPAEVERDGPDNEAAEQRMRDDHQVSLKEKAARVAASALFVAAGGHLFGNIEQRLPSRVESPQAVQQLVTDRASSGPKDPAPESVEGQATDHGPAGRNQELAGSVTDVSEEETPDHVPEHGDRDAGDLDENLNQLAEELVEERRRRDESEDWGLPGDDPSPGDADRDEASTGTEPDSRTGDTGSGSGGRPTDTVPGVIADIPRNDPGAGAGSHRRPHADRVEEAPSARVLSTFLPPSGDHITNVHAIDPVEVRPEWQDDNNRDPMAEGRAEMREQLRSAEPPDELLYKGGNLPESRVELWKQGLERAERGDAHPPVYSPDVVSTTRDPITALTYLEGESSQSIGRPAAAGGAIERGPGGSGQRVDRSQTVPGHEILASGKFADEYAARKGVAAASGDTAAHAGAERLYRTVESKLDESGNFPPTPYLEGVRRDGMDERVLSGDYELAGLLDTRSGHEFDIGETSSYRLPGGGDPPPGVYVVFRPVAAGPDDR